MAHKSITFRYNEEKDGQPWERSVNVDIFEGMDGRANRLHISPDEQNPANDGREMADYRNHVVNWGCDRWNCEPHQFEFAEHHKNGFEVIPQERTAEGGLKVPDNARVTWTSEALMENITDPYKQDLNNLQMPTIDDD